uniref:EF-hand domain-containing protein n=1 Tax=Denticeps clupeoides TaxID=299321 RepID=A0AAY4BRR2_9TELE
MDEEEQNRYVTQLKDEFDSCDTTGTGYLDKEELTALCHKLHLDAHLPLLLNTLLGPQHYARVNFEEFKEGFVAVLSQSLDFSTSEEESSYLEPVVPEEVKPKYVKGTKRYGRKSKPESPSSELTADSEGRSPFTADPSENTGVRRPKLRRATSLESVESLKSDEETEGKKKKSHNCVTGQQRQWNQDSAGSPQCSLVLKQGVTDIQVRAVWEELGVGAGGSLSRQELSVVCEHIGLKDLQTEELDALFRKLDKDQDGRVSLREFQTGLFRYADLPPPKSSSTPLRPSSAQTIHSNTLERPVRSISPSLLSATVGQKLLTRLDDGSGCTSPDRVITLWTEEGIRNSRDILQTLDFSLDERLGLLLASGNGIHQAALISYKNEIQFLQWVGLAEQACRERDKVKADLEWANRRNLQLVREVEDRHATLESLNETKIRGLEQDFRDKLTALRSESEQDSEVLLERVEQEQTKLKEEVEILRAQDVSLQEEICTAVQENSRLEEEVSALKGKLTESQCTISRLQKDLDHLLQDKVRGLGTMFHLSSWHRVSRKSRRLRESMSSLKWSGRRALTTESDSDDPEMKKATSPHVKKKLQIENKNVLSSLDSLSAPVSIETELAMEQMKVKYEQEVHDLKIQLETKVNFYERTMELMRNNMEVERKDISYGFKIEISELEEQKAQAEEHVVRLKQAMEKLEAQQHTRVESGAWGSEHERRFQRERAELEQNYVREMGNIVQRLTSEKDQLEAEMKLKMDQEVLLVRTQLNDMNSENRALKDRLAVLQQDFKALEEETDKKKKKLGELEREQEKKREEEERLHKENAKYREEVLDLSGRNLQLSTENAELSSRLRSDESAVQMLTERLALVCQQQEDGASTIRQLQESSSQRDREMAELQASWLLEQGCMERELKKAREKTHNLSEIQSALANLTLKHQQLEKDHKNLLQVAEERHAKIEKLQETICDLDNQTDQLHSQLQAMTQDKASCFQEMATHQRLLHESQDKVSLSILANTALSLVQAQHTREVQQMREQVGVGSREQLVQIQGQLTEQQRRSQQMEETLRSQAQKASAQLALKQEQYEKVMVHMQERVEELEAKLKNVRAMLQEKVNQLKEQLAKNAKSDLLLKDLYVENSQLMKALQITEQRQKSAEKKSFLLEEKVATLNKLLRKIAPASLSA